MQIAEPLVARHRTGPAHHLHAVAHVGTVEKGLLVVGVEILEAGCSHVAHPVATVEAVLSIDISGDAEVVAVGIEHSPRVAGALGLYLRVNEPFVGCYLLVRAAPIVETEGSLQTEILEGHEPKGVRHLKALDVAAVVL